MTGKHRHHPFLSTSYRIFATVMCVLLLLSYVSVLIDPATVPLAGFFGLYYIPVLAINVLLLVISLLRWSSSAWIPLTGILPTLFFVGYFVRTGDRNQVPEQVAEGSPGITVLTYNVGGFRAGTGDNNDNAAGIRALVARESPDVVLLQEYRTGEPASIARDFPGYPHVSRHFYRLRNGDYVGNVTLSRLPVTEEGYLDFKGSTNMVLYTDIEYEGRALRLYNVHLESNNISLTALVKKIGGGYEEFSQEIAEVHEKVRKSSTRRGGQVQALLDNISESGQRSVICGDVNDTPMSYCFRSLIQGRKDTFCEAGKGFGATYRILWPLLRIDYIFVPEEATVAIHRTPKVAYSDHYPVIAKLSI